MTCLGDPVSFHPTDWADGRERLEIMENQKTLLLGLGSPTVSFGGRYSLFAEDMVFGLKLAKRGEWKIGKFSF